MKVTVESFDQLMAVNARGTMLCYKHAAKQMISQGRGGRIIGAYPASFLSYIALIRGIRQGQVRKPESRVISLAFFHCGWTKAHVSTQQPIPSPQLTAQLNLPSAVSRKRLASHFFCRNRCFADKGMLFSSRVWTARNHRERICSRSTRHSP